mmetsp:Transcript_45324/g.129393  ORF Transcript_45324/g.129393 Transcript_45324/m.129393 type:complete len:249 (+) Transcript_45324:174-920(+)
MHLLCHGLAWAPLHRIVCVPHPDRAVQGACECEIPASEGEAGAIVPHAPVEHVQRGHVLCLREVLCRIRPRAQYHAPAATEAGKGGAGLYPLPRPHNIFWVCRCLCYICALPQTWSVQVSNWERCLDHRRLGADCVSDPGGGCADIRRTFLVHAPMRACCCQRLFRLLLRRGLRQTLHQGPLSGAVAEQDMGGLHWSVFLHGRLGLVVFGLDLQQPLARVPAAGDAGVRLPGLQACRAFPAPEDSFTV